MNELPPYLSRLKADNRLRLSELPKSSEALLRGLFAGGVIEVEKSGRGEVVVVRRVSEFDAWLSSHFPSFGAEIRPASDLSRAAAIAARRNSKATGLGVSKGVLQFRALGSGDADLSVDGVDLTVNELTEKFGLAACLIGADTELRCSRGRFILVENLECFLNAERFFEEDGIALYSAGRVSDRLIACLERSLLGNKPLVHFPDYDPVGLHDYLRLRKALGSRVELFLPEDRETLFKRFSNRELISGKSRNRELLEKLNAQNWPCENSSLLFKLVMEHGAGLEQEALLLRMPE